MGILSEQNFKAIPSQILTYLNTSTTPNQIDIYIYCQSFTYASFNLIRNGVNSIAFNSVANWSVTAPVISGTYTLVHDTNVKSIININTNLKRIGINKPAPAYPLDVIGDINLTDNLRINGIAALSNTTFNIPTISNVLNIYSSNITASNIYTPTISNVSNIYTTNITASNITGNFLNINTPIPSITNSTSLLYLSNLTSGFNLVLYNSSNVTNPNTCALECLASPLYISVGGAERGSFLQNGHVGIRTSNPYYPLNVVGDINLTGNLNINGVPLSTSTSASNIISSNITNSGVIFTPTLSNVNWLWSSNIYNKTQMYTGQISTPME
jgi:hypothetical protein